MKKLLALLFCPCTALAVQGYSLSQTTNGISYISDDGSSYVACELIDNMDRLSTTKDYAQYMMDSYQGWQLQPIISLNGFSFKYVDNAPCAALLKPYDGARYIIYKVCGNVSKRDLNSLIKQSDIDLKKQ